MKQKKSLVSLLSYIAACLFIFNGICKVFHILYGFEILPDMPLDFMEKMDFTKPGATNFTPAIIVGIIEIAGAIGLLIPSSRATVSFLMILLVVGAIGSEIGAGFKLMTVILPAIAFVLLSAIAYYDNMIAAEEEEEQIEHRFDNAQQ